jgi:hypothetical protein
MYPLPVKSNFALIRNFDLVFGADAPRPLPQLRTVRGISGLNIETSNPGAPSFLLTQMPIKKPPDLGVDPD